MTEIPKGYRRLEFGERKAIGDLYWGWLDQYNPDGSDNLNPHLGWIPITEPEPLGEEFIDEGHVATIRKIE